MSFATKAKPSEKALDRQVLDLAATSTEKRFPERPSYARSGGRGIVKWACGGCEFWTGYNSRTRLNRMILNHVTGANRREAIDTAIVELAAGEHHIGTLTIVLGAGKHVIWRSDCPTCVSVGRVAVAPDHSPSAACESGRRPHCTCTRCF